MVRMSRCRLIGLAHWPPMLSRAPPIDTGPSERRSDSATSPVLRGVTTAHTVTGFWPWAGGAVVLGAGTAMVYPTLLAAIGDVAHPAWRARSVGIYRLWRDGGFAVGALTAGVLADLASVEVAIYAVAALTAASGVVVVVRMHETHRPARS